MSETLEPAAGETEAFNVNEEHEGRRKLTEGRAAFAAAFVEIPEWGFSKAVFEHLKTEDHDIATCLGPAVPVLRRSAVMELIVVGLFYGMAYSDRHFGFSVLWKYLAVSPALLYRHYAEIVAVRHITPPYVDDALRAKEQKIWAVFGVKTSFKVWLLVYIFFSGLQTLDLLTDTAFAATTIQKIIAAGNHGKHDGIHERWEDIWNAMTFDAIPMVPPPRIGFVVLIIWSLALLQLIEPLIYTFPRTRGVKYEIGSDGLQHCPFNRLNFEGIFLFLAEATHMATVQSLAFLQGKHELYRVRPEQVPSWAFSMVNEMWKRSLFGILLENCLQLYVQVLLFTIQESTKDEPHYQQGVSIGISIFMSLVKVKELVDFEQYRKLVDSKTASDEELEAYVRDNPQDRVFLGCKRGMWWRFQYIRIVGVLIVICLAYSTAVLIGSYHCESKLWCWAGCVDVEH